MEEEKGGAWNLTGKCVEERWRFLTNLVGGEVPLVGHEGIPTEEEDGHLVVLYGRRVRTDAHHRQVCGGGTLCNNAHLLSKSLTENITATTHDVKIIKQRDA